MAFETEKGNGKDIKVDLGDPPKGAPLLDEKGFVRSDLEK